MFLPRPEFPKFSGDPLEYQAFMQNFETHVEPLFQIPKNPLPLLDMHWKIPQRKDFLVCFGNSKKTTSPLR